MPGLLCNRWNVFCLAIVLLLQTCRNQTAREKERWTSGSCKPLFNYRYIAFRWTSFMELQTAYRGQSDKLSWDSWINCCQSSEQGILVSVRSKKNRWKECVTRNHHFQERKKEAAGQNSMCIAFQCSVTEELSAFATHFCCSPPWNLFLGTVQFLGCVLFFFLQNKFREEPVFQTWEEINAPINQWTHIQNKHRFLSFWDRTRSQTPKLVCSQPQQNPPVLEAIQSLKFHRAVGKGKTSSFVHTGKRLGSFWLCNRWFGKHRFSGIEGYCSLKLQWGALDLNQFVSFHLKSHQLHREQIDLLPP